MTFPVGKTCDHARKPTISVNSKGQVVVLVIPDWTASVRWYNLLFVAQKFGSSYNLKIDYKR